MKTITLTDDDQTLVRTLAIEHPGVSQHRLARALWRLGCRVYEQQGELLDHELARIDQEAQERRAARRGPKEKP